MRQGRLYIGTSGWMYDAWKHNFYEGVPKKLWLSYISERMTSVEVDATFYRQQKPETYQKWAEQTPPEFKFAVRGHRYLSHNKKLLDVSEPLRRVREQAEGLGEKLGPVLWQLPPFVRLSPKRIVSFGEELRDAWPEALHALEFRHESWFTQEIAEILTSFGIANCISDAGSFPRWDAVTTDWIYMRFHGKPYTYWSRYEDDDLTLWSDFVAAHLALGRDVFAYFDNDANGHAPWDALRLKKLVESKTAWALNQAA